jgi:large subunit ribosomal protein L31e
MAEEKTQKIEREMTVPLRRFWLNVARFRRGGKAIKALKKFVAKHMKVPERDTDKVKIDMYLNNEILFRGRKNPPAKVKVKATKEGDIVKVTFVETPKHVVFLKAKHEKLHKKAAEKKPEKKEEKKEETKEEKKEEVEEKKVEVEKEKAVAEQGVKEAKQESIAQKHTTQVKPETFHRKAMKR